MTYLLAVILMLSEKIEKSKKLKVLAMEV